MKFTIVTDFKRCQEEGETFEQFATRLQILIKDCKYPEQDKMVRDRIVIGIKNQMIREKLIKLVLISPLLKQWK